MALSEVDIANLALSALGTNDSISTLTEVSREAQQCNRWFEPVRDAIFRSAPWTSLTAYKRLALLVERDDDEDWLPTDPTPGYLYAYAAPSDMIYPRYESNYTRFIMANVGDTPALMMNVTTPILTYTKKQTQVNLWDIDLQQAVAFGIAAHIAKAITGKDSDLQNMFTLANEKIALARQNSANASTDMLPEVVPSWIAARGYAETAPDTRFVYPPGQFTVLGMNNLG